MASRELIDRPWTVTDEALATSTGIARLTLGRGLGRLTCKHDLSQGSHRGLRTTHGLLNGDCSKL